MTDRDPEAPTPATARAVLDRVAPGSRLLAVEPLPASYSNYTHVVRGRGPGTEETKVAVRRYAVLYNYDLGEKAHREFETLRLLHRHRVPAPEPLLLDRDGSLLGSPGIVTGFVDGRQVDRPRDPVRWAQTLAMTLAQIHRIPCGPGEQAFLLDALRETTWFVRKGAVPDHMQAHPDGPAVWHAVSDGLATARPVPQGLVHVDYWSGNILWEGDRISAVLDWEEAAYGDPGYDVAYCRMDMILAGLEEAADRFLEAYEAEMGRPVANLRLWELASAERPMHSPAGWIDRSPARERFRAFVARALEHRG